MQLRPGNSSFELMLPILARAVSVKYSSYLLIEYLPEVAVLCE